MAFFGFGKSEEEKNLSETTRGGFERQRPTFIEKAKEKVKTRFKEEVDFQKKIGTAKREAYKKERISMAKREGKQKARQGLFSRAKLGSAITQGSKKEKPRKSNLERLMGL